MPSNNSNVEEVRTLVKNVLRALPARQLSLEQDIHGTDPITNFGGGGTKNVKIMRTILDALGAEVGEREFQEVYITNSEALLPNTSLYQLATVNDFVNYVWSRVNGNSKSVSNNSL